MQSFLLTAVYKIYFHYTGWVALDVWSCMSFKKCGAATLSEAVKQFPHGLYTDSANALIYLRLAGLNWDERVLQGIDPAVLAQLTRILKPGSKEKKDLAALGGLTANQIKAATAKDANFPTENIISPEFIDRLLRVGACAKEATSLKITKHKFDQIIQTSINHMHAYDLFLETFTRTYDDRNYAASVAYREEEGKTHLTDDIEWIKLGSSLLGLRARGFLPGCKQAIFYDPDLRPGSHDSAVIGFHSFLGPDHLNGKVEYPIFRPRDTDEAGKHGLFGMKELWLYAKLLKEGLERPVYFPVPHYASLHDYLIAVAGYYNGGLERDGEVSPCSQPELFSTFTPSSLGTSPSCATTPNCYNIRISTVTGRTTISLLSTPLLSTLWEVEYLLPN